MFMNGQNVSCGSGRYLGNSVSDLQRTETKQLVENGRSTRFKEKLQI